jgi:exopolyphosphatase/guanosine-5'-triphosphate,3'-diphosphate pyrophosphatase
MPERRLLAAVDLGSNSFRLLIGRVESTPVGDQIQPIDSLKESVRLAAGLGADGTLDAASQRRAAEALHRFGERLRSFSPDAVRAVATNTLRVARNGAHVHRTAEAALGFPIEVISGHEEARLIYLGAAHALARDDRDRLVIDIGGGSTESIIGHDYEPLRLESIGIGCVSLSRRWFPDGAVDRDALEHAVNATRAAFAPIALAYRRQGWDYAVGTSGTAKALCQAVAANFGTDVLTRDGLAQLADALLKAGHVDRVRLDSLKPDRRPVLAGGLAAMIGVFDELGITAMRYCAGALRQGALYDLLGRSQGSDMREVTVSRMVGRYGADDAQGRRVAITAQALFGQAARGTVEDLAHRHKLLGWAAQLAEIGVSISHEDYHKHSSYVLLHADMPGFTQAEQVLMAHLALAQTGGLRKLKPLIVTTPDWLMALSLRIASILHRRRDDREVTVPALFFKRGRVRIEVPKSWARAHPLSHDSLQAEALAWTELGVFGEFAYQTL